MNVNPFLVSWDRSCGPSKKPKEVKIKIIKMVALPKKSAIFILHILFDKNSFKVKEI